MVLGGRSDGHHVDVENKEMQNVTLPPIHEAQHHNYGSREDLRLRDKALSNEVTEREDRDHPEDAFDVDVDGDELGLDGVNCEDGQGGEENYKN